MATILFEQIGGGETETPPPSGTGIGALRLRCVGYGVVSGGMGTMSLRLRMAGEGEGGTELDEPFMAIGEGVLRLIAGYSVGPEVAEPAEMEGSLRLVGGFASGGTGYSTDAVGDMQFTLNGGGLGPYPELEGGGGGEEGPGFEPEYEGVFLGDTMGLTGDALAEMTVLLASELRILTTSHAEWTAHTAMADGLELAEQLAGIYHVLMQSSLELTGVATVDHTILVQMMDALLLSGSVATEWEAYATLVEAIAFGDLLSAAEIATLTDAIDFTEAVAQSYEGAARLVDALLLEAALSGAATFAVAMRDDLDLSDSAAVTAELLAALRDEIGFVARLHTETGDYIAWAMNTATRGMTRFTNYPFNSFMTVGGKTYGIAETGRYLLGGATDAGEPINASIRLGMSAMGSMKLKRIPEAFLGYTADGQMQLKVITASPTDGLREALVYTLFPSMAGSQREGRIKIGRGLKSVYFDFELVNVEGSDFSLDVVTVRPLILDRLLRGNAGSQ